MEFIASYYHVIRSFRQGLINQQEQVIDAQVNLPRLVCNYSSLGSCFSSQFSTLLSLTLPIIRPDCQSKLF